MRKTAIVTGGSRGIGRAIAIALSHEYNVVINYCGSEDRANEVLAECTKNGSDSMIFKADVSDSAAVNDMIKAVSEKYESIDVVVNNSGITKDNLILRMSEEDFEKVIDINLKGCFNVSKAVLKSMLKQKSGSIINMASVIGEIGNIGQANYAASKAGVIALTKTIAKEGAHKNVRCNAIAPGFIQTEMTDVLSDSVKEAILNNIPMKELGKPEDIANLVLFLSGENSRYITGQVINVDGGMVM